MRKIHILKIKDIFWDSVKSLKKTFEVRKDDRDFKVGDLIRFVIVDSDSGLICARAHCLFEVTYKLTSDDFPDGLKDGYCILGIEPLIE